MLSSASRGAPTARALHSRRASIACATCQQRAFRFGPWIDASAETETTKSRRKRHNRCGFSYRYMKSIRSRWDGEGEATEADPLLVKATEILKENMESNPKSPKGSHYINIDKDLKPGARPGRSIEDAERDAINQLFDSRSDPAQAHYDLWRKPLNNIRNMLHAEQAPKQAVPDEVIHATATSPESDEGHIDPITNRRTPRQRPAESSTFTPKFEDVDQQPNLQSSQKETYEKVQWNEPEGLPRKTREEESKQYNDLDNYRSSKWNQSDGLPKITPQEEANVEVTAEEPGKEYADLDKYKPVYWNEPDGLPKPTPEELSKEYDDLHRYGPVKWNEPDGLPQTVAEGKTVFDDGLSHAEEDVLDHEGVRADPESHSVRRHPEQAFRDYDHLGNYGNPVIDNVDAPYRVHYGEQTKKYSDLDHYDPQNFDSPAPPESSMLREASNSFSDLGSYTQRSQPQGISSAGASGNHSGNDGQDGEEGSKLDNLTPEEIRANVLRRVSKQTSSMKQHRQEMATNYQDEWDPAVKEAQEQLEREHPRKLTGNYARDFPEEFSTSWSTTNSPSQTTLFPDDHAVRTRHDNESREEVEPSSMDESFPSESSRLEPALDRQARRPSAAANMSRETRDAESEAMMQNLIDQGLIKPEVSLSSNQPFSPNRGMSEADFEEVMKEAEEKLSAQLSTQQSYAQAAKPSPLNGATSEAVFQKAIKEAEEKLAAQSTQSASTPSPEATQASSGQRFAKADFQAAVEEAEQRLSAQQSTPQSTPEPVALGSAGETRQASEARFQEAVQEAEEKLQAQQSASAKTSTTYKILAYDPTTDLIRTAETSSSVDDTSSPLTPADVIPRLSNPTKFFAHFSGLQSQGYEIVSGERDVLVFRKVNSSPAPEPKYEPPSRVNPIDMMGKPPVTGNFASPTGFVNYDSVEEPELKPEPPFRSNIDVRREEPVYSGPKTDLGKEKKRGLGKKVIMGTAYVAAGAYAVGVMGEYFSTRGAPPRPGVEPTRASGEPTKASGEPIVRRL